MAISKRIACGDGAALHLTVQGSGAPVLLLHGFTADGTIWGWVGEALAPLPLTVQVLDLRGHGQSRSWSCPADVNDFAADVAAVFEQLDLEDLVLVGHSLGGMVIQALAARRPDLVTARVRGVLLVNTSSRPLATRATRLTGAFLQSRLLDAINRSPRLRFAFARRAFPSPVPADRIRVQAAIEPPDRASRRAFRVDSIPDFTRFNADLKVPTTVLGSARDLAIPARSTAALAESLPNARLRLLPDTGHLLPLERPDIVAEEIVRLTRPKVTSP
jgi:pimeloyl-ACP methyl ester carboxylesterase